MKRLLALLVVATTLAGCGAWKIPTRLGGEIPAKGSVVPETNLHLTPSITYPLEKLVFWGTYIGVAYLILDPLAPNWEIEEAKFPEDRYHMSLHMKRLYAGGAGEARLVFHNRAKALMEAGGYSSYEVLEYSEGMESSVLGSKRTAAGVVRLSRNLD